MIFKTFEDYQKFARRLYNVTFVLKVTNRCPQNCEYCYHKYNSSEDMTMDMDINLAKEAILKIAPGFKDVNFHIHGGEPLVRSAEFLDGIYSFIQTYKQAMGDKQKISIATQSNLIHLTDEKLNIMKKHGVALSTSYDGLSYEVNRKENRDNFVKNYEKIDFPLGLITVVTKETMKNIDAEIEHLETVPNGSPMANAVFPYCCPEELKLDPGDYADFVIRRFEYQLKNNRPLSYETLRYFKVVAFDGRGGDCFTDPCLNSIITVNPSGNIKGCDTRNDDFFIYGNIKDIKNIYDVYELEGYKRMERATYERLKKCESCEAYKYCNSGCISRMTVVNNEMLGKDSFCYDIKKMINYFKDFYAKYDNDIEKMPENVKMSLKEFNRKVIEGGAPRNE